MRFVVAYSRGKETNQSEQERAAEGYNRDVVNRRVCVEEYLPYNRVFSWNITQSLFLSGLKLLHFIPYSLNSLILNVSPNEKVAPFLIWGILINRYSMHYVAMFNHHGRFPKCSCVWSTFCYSTLFIDILYPRAHASQQVKLNDAI